MWSSGTDIELLEVTCTAWGVHRAGRVEEVHDVHGNDDRELNRDGRARRVLDSGESRSEPGAIDPPATYLQDSGERLVKVA
jgi:hypothetical protein